MALLVELPTDARNASHIMRKINAILPVYHYVMYCCKITGCVLARDMNVFIPEYVDGRVPWHMNVLIPEYVDGRLPWQCLVLTDTVSLKLHNRYVIDFQGVHATTATTGESVIPSRSAAPGTPVRTVTFVSMPSIRRLILVYTLY